MRRLRKVVARPELQKIARGDSETPANWQIGLTEPDWTEPYKPLFCTVLAKSETRTICVRELERLTRPPGYLQELPRHSRGNRPKATRLVVMRRPVENEVNSSSAGFLRLFMFEAK